jgi:tRNA(Ile)-lysidine synthase
MELLSANMLEIVKSVVASIEQDQLFPAHSTIVVAVSGGADSLCLLHLLHQLCGPDRHYPHVHLHVAHLDHQLRPEASARDADAVKRLAESWQLPVTLGVVAVSTLAREKQLSLEEAARIARYRFLRTVARSLPAPTRIAVAHHRDDQVETLLLHWLRGGGIASMVGLQARQQDIIRPLLSVTHAETLAYCQQHQLEPLEDESNTDPRFLRNRVRHELLPLLESLNPGIRATLLRNAEVLQVDAAWIEAQVDAAWSTVVTAEHPTSISLQRIALLALPLSLQRHLLRRVSAHLSEGQSPLELRHYKLIEAMLQQPTGALHLPGHLSAIYRGGSLIFTLNNDIQPGHVARSLLHDNEEVVLPIPARVVVPNTSWIACADVVAGAQLQAAREALQREDWPTLWRVLVVNRYVVYVDAASIVGAALRVRTRSAGDRMRPLGMVHEKKIQDILVDRHIARAERERIPLFFSAAHCVWLAGIAIDDRVRLSSATREIVRLSIIPDEAL